MTLSPASTVRRLPWFLAALVCCAAGPGCVERRMTIRSNPPGAMVYIDNREIGTTPVSTGFTYYGTREFRLAKDGYETLTEKRTIPVPWYEYVPLDFVAENIVPGEIRDHRTLDFQLTPQRIVPTEEILDRAEGLRRQTRGFGVVQAGPPPGPPAVAAPGRGQPAFGARPAAPPGPWGLAPPAVAPSSPQMPPFGPGGPPPWTPGAPPIAPPGPPSNDLLPYPTEPPGGWQPRT